MATIGLYDWDMNYYIHVPPNLEIMKLSSYYKKKYILTNMATSFSPDKFTEFIVRKDYEDRNYPNELFLPNVKRGGHAFSGPTYKSLGEEIEMMAPDTFCYEKLAPLFCNNLSNTGMFNAFLNAQHIRLSLDGKTIWPDYEKTFNKKNPRCYFFHDYDLNAIDDARECIVEYLKRRKGRVYVGTKFPIQVNSTLDLYKWSNFRVMQKNYSIQYNGVMPDEVFVNWLELQNHTSMSAQLHYNVTHGCSSEKEFAEQRLPKILNQVIYSWNHWYKISLKYEEHFFIEKKWEQFIDFLNGSLNVTAVKMDRNLGLRQDPLYQFAKHFRPKKRYGNEFMTLGEVREVFQFIREQNHEVFKDLYEKTKVILKGGELVDDTARHKR